MSCHIRTYPPLGQGEAMDLTAFMGPSGDRRQIQFTIGDRFAQLSTKALLDLISTITRRLLYEEGFTATGCEHEDILFDEEYDS